MVTLVTFRNDFLAHAADDDNPHLLTASMFGLELVNNLPLATDAMVVDGTSDGGYMTPRLVAITADTMLDALFDDASNIGDVPFATVNSEDPVDFGPPITQLAVVDTADDLTLQQSSQQDWSAVFNSWERFAYTTPTAGDYGTEADSFIYDEQADTIYSPLNSESVIGFVSPGRYENYTLDVQLSADNADDDYIGVVVGFVHVGNERHILTVMSYRHRGVTAPTLGIIMDNVPVPAELPTTVAEATSTETFQGGFRNWNLIPNGIRLRVVRTGDLIECWMGPDDSTELGASPTYASVNLTDIPDLAMFRGPQPIGYTAMSQANGTWYTYETPIFTTSRIIDLVNGQVLTQVDSVWTDTGEPVTDYIKQARGYYNPTTEKLFLGTGNGTVLLLSDMGRVRTVADYVNQLETRVEALEAAS